MDVVYDVWFTREYVNREDTELHIGLYRTEDDAKAAVERLKDLPGFRDWPQGFDIHAARLNQDGWTKGFKTVYGAPPKDAQAEAFDLPFWVDTEE